jgi:hypothetical protein
MKSPGEALDLRISSAANIATDFSENIRFITKRILNSIEAPARTLQGCVGEGLVFVENGLSISTTHWDENEARVFNRLETRPEYRKAVSEILAANGLYIYFNRKPGQYLVTSTAKPPPQPVRRFPEYWVLSSESNGNLSAAIDRLSCRGWRMFSGVDAASSSSTENNYHSGDITVHNEVFANTMVLDPSIEHFVKVE